MQVYAHDTMEEILGWYGLQTTSTTTSASSLSDNASIVSASKIANPTQRHHTVDINAPADGGQSVPFHAVAATASSGDEKKVQDQRPRRVKEDDHPLDLTSMSATAQSRVYWKELVNSISLTRSRRVLSAQYDWRAASTWCHVDTLYETISFG